MLVSLVDDACTISSQGTWQEFAVTDHRKEICEHEYGITFTECSATSLIRVTAFSKCTSTASGNVTT